ncbi:hypothetical protein HK104_011382 [Borealophlyctis nickersoniae]|nr:hypothetical protein HK104_011382 [Borealophlyctis nickersoniae]
MSEPPARQMHAMGAHQDVGQPPCPTRWFHAVDVPKHDNTPYKLTAAGPTKSPSVWKQFSVKDSAALETAFQSLLKQKEEEKGKPDRAQADYAGVKVPVNEDHLFEADVDKRETYPVYWHGPTYEIRRGTWFYAAAGGNFYPCDENLARQVEDGYRKFQPWKDVPPTPSSVPTSISSSTKIDYSELPKLTDTKNEARWPLLGPYIGQYVVYSGPKYAWQFSDQLAGKIQRSLMNLGGTRLVRGWDEIVKLKKKATAKPVAKPADKEKEAEKEPAPSLPEGSSLAESLPSGKMTVEEAQKMQEKIEAEDYDEDQEDADREIEHLVLVIHGIGQKLGERVEAVNFVHDCNLVRRAFKTCAEQYTAAKDQLRGSRKSAALNMPTHGGVQVLPVKWRHKLTFGGHSEGTGLDGVKEGEDGKSKETTLEDITLDGVPSIRMLVSDVIMDVLLYMTPRYRQEMVKHVTDELNRIYNLFKQRNPNFKGKVSLYGHSLGSLLAFDILCNQPSGPKGQAERSVPKKKPAEVDLSDLIHGTSGTAEGAKGLMDRPTLKYEELDFEVDRLFGDKLRARLLDIAHGADTKVDAGALRPAAKAIYNIFSPHDPVAYRIEPIIKKEYAAVKPALIPYTKGGLKGAVVGIQDLGSDLVDRAHNMLGSVWARTAGVVSSAGKVASIVTAFKSSSSVKSDAEEHPEGVEGSREAGLERGSTSESLHDARLSDDADLGRLNPRGRIDFMLQPSMLENPYLSALGVHMNYWPDSDCAMFMLTELYGVSKEGSIDDDPEHSGDASRKPSLVVSATSAGGTTTATTPTTAAVATTSLNVETSPKILATTPPRFGGPFASWFGSSSSTSPAPPPAPQPAADSAANQDIPLPIVAPTAPNSRIMSELDRYSYL